MLMFQELRDFFQQLKLLRLGWETRPEMCFGVSSIIKNYFNFLRYVL